MFKNFVASITHNAISLIGTAIAVAALVLMASLFGMEILGLRGRAVPRDIDVPDPADDLRRRADPDSDRRGSLPPQARRRPEGTDDTPLLPVFDLNVKSTRRWMLIFSGCDDAEYRHCCGRDLQGRARHGVGGVLRPRVSLGHGARTYGARTVPALASCLCRVPHRSWR